MSTQLTGASAKILFESPAQLKLKKKLLKEGNFEIVSSGPESATNLDKGITVVRTKQETGRDALTDAPIYEYTEFEIKHPRENIADVLRRRLPRDAKGQLTVPGLAAPTLTALNAILANYGVYLEPKEFTLVKQGDAAFNLTAKKHCVIFYGKITVTNTPAVTAPKEEYEAEGDGEGEPSGDPLISNLAYSLDTNNITAFVTNANTATVATSTGFTDTTPVTDEEVNYTFAQMLPMGTKVTLSARTAKKDVYVNPQPTALALEHEVVGKVFNKKQLAVKLKVSPANYVVAVTPSISAAGNVGHTFTDNQNVVLDFSNTPNYSNVNITINVDGVEQQIETLYVAPLPAGQKPNLVNLGYDNGSRTVNLYTNDPSTPIYVLVNGELHDEAVLGEMTMHENVPGFSVAYAFESPLAPTTVVTIQQGDSSVEFTTPWIPDMANPLTVTVTEVTATGLKGKASKYDEMGNVKITLASDAEAVFNVGLSNKGEFVWDYSNPLLDGEVITFTTGTDTVEYTVIRAPKG